MASQPAPLLLLLLLLALLRPAQTHTEPTDPEPSPMPTPIPEGNSSATRPLASIELKAGALHPAPGWLALLALLAPRPVLG